MKLRRAVRMWFTETGKFWTELFKTDEQIRDEWRRWGEEHDRRFPPLKRKKG